MAHLFPSKDLLHPTWQRDWRKHGFGLGVEYKFSYGLLEEEIHVWSAGEHSELERQMWAFSKNREHQRAGAKSG